MRRRMNYKLFLYCLRKHLQDHTSMQWWFSGDNQEAPFGFIEMQTTEDDDTTKTFYRTNVSVNLHIISGLNRPSSAVQKGGNNKEYLFDLIQETEEALTVPFEFPPSCPFRIDGFTGGFTRDQKDPSGELHAILGYEFSVSYGHMRKE